MEKAYAERKAVEADYGRGVGGTQAQCIGSFGGSPLGEIRVGSQAPGILSMTNSAHEAFGRLSTALSDLYERLSPLMEVSQEAAGTPLQNPGCEAPAITGLRILVERIDDKSAEIHRLLSALRV